MKKTTLFCALAAFALFFTSCTTEINLELNKDGSVKASFNGTTGKGFEKLIRNTQGLKEGQAIFDVKEIKKELTASGLSSVTVESKTGKDLSLSMVDTKRNSNFFTSGLVSLKNNRIVISLNPSTMEKFYNLSDPQIVLYLDMLLSPVFNQEEMSPEEYEEVITSFYGKDVAKEIKETQVKLKIKNPDGSKAEYKLPLIDLLTLNKSLQLE